MAAKYNGRYIADVTIPDDTPISAGTTFSKTWRVENNGTAAWGPGFSFVFVKGTSMAAVNRIPLPPAAPGTQVEITISLTAPTRTGTHFCDWRFQDDKGNVFGEIIYTRINVIPSAAPPPVDKNDSYFLADVTIPDDTQFQPGAAFTKTWRVRNSGTRPWGQGYTLNWFGGTAMTPVTSIPVPTVAPGAEANLSVSLTAPTNPGTYFGDWRLKDDKGQVFGATLWVRIVVPAPSGPTPGLQQGSREVPAGFVNIAPHFSQRDNRWGTAILGNVSNAPSIARWGCLMTCFVMIAAAKGKSVDPGQFNQLMVQRGGFINGYFTRWNALQIVYPDIVYSDKVDGSADMLARIDASLNEKRPVTALVDFTPLTQYSDNDQHWVLIVGRNGSDYLINDPWMLDGQPVSLMKHYGRPGGTLQQALRSAIFYR
ncbi:MAG: NBR1-Ig-like domain-containing protein [bacterium]|nr:NBR1-Ig-like domain-containing protein [bacterium]